MFNNFAVGRQYNFYRSIYLKINQLLNNTTNYNFFENRS